MSTALVKSSSRKKFTGYLQPSYAKANAKPAVVYNRGGCDFRITNPSSLGPQHRSGPHLTSAGMPIFAEAERFRQAEFRSPGPKYDPVSSMGKQQRSTKPTAGGIKFGTSSRESAMKLYAIYTTKK
ncbi:hypothetical protein TeGR_g10679 [Tetraparma gracilis]|uniref:Uncharacterized protein n=1 Tax=Tetraparma gracilis TaxID=2962635 RepID=A0ABQ6NC63_9STRA|nr:hypothetical protein TeGR_g10679 [Tetraparma gracilis]